MVRDSGFSLIELITVLAIVSILMLIAAIPIRAYMDANGFANDAQSVRDDLVFAHERVVSEAAAGHVYGIAFVNGSNSYVIFEDDPSNVVRTITMDDALIDTAQCTDADTETTSATCSFYARGSATAGTVEVRQSGSSRCSLYTISPLTGRVDDGACV